LERLFESEGRNSLRRRYPQDVLANAGQILVKDAYDVVDDPRGIHENQRSR